MMIAFAAFQSKQTSWDLVALVGIAILGIFMRRFDWSRPAFLIGFVLSDQAEVYTYQVVQVANSKFSQGTDIGWSYVLSPIVITLMVITIVSVWLGARQAGSLHQQTNKTYHWNKTPAVVFAAFLGLFMLVALIDGTMVWTMTDKVFPITIATVGLITSILLLVKMRRQADTHSLFYDREIGEDEKSAPHGLWPMMGWFVSLLALNAAFGFVIAISLFFIIFLRVQAKISWIRILVLTACGVSFLVFMASMLNREFPSGLLQDMVELPWPLRGR